MKTAEEILSGYVYFDDVNGNETVELLPLTIVDMMEEFTLEQLKAFLEWYNNLSQEEIAWYEGRYEEVFLNR